MGTVKSLMALPNVEVVPGAESVYLGTIECSDCHSWIESTLKAVLKIGVNRCTVTTHDSPESLQFGFRVTAQTEKSYNMYDFVIHVTHLKNSNSEISKRLSKFKSREIIAKCLEYGMNVDKIEHAVLNDSIPYLRKNICVKHSRDFHRVVF